MLWSARLHYPTKNSSNVKFQSLLQRDANVNERRVHAARLIFYLFSTKVNPKVYDALNEAYSEDFIH